MKGKLITKMSNDQKETSFLCFATLAILQNVSNNIKAFLIISLNMLFMDNTSII